MAKKAATEESLSVWLSRHAATIKGMTLVIAGLVLIAFTSPVIVKLMVLVAGGLLVYAGLTVLRANSITNFIDEVMRRMR